MTNSACQKRRWMHPGTTRRYNVEPENVASNSYPRELISRPTASNPRYLIGYFRGRKPVKPTASTGSMERAMGIQPTSETWENTMPEAPIRLLAGSVLVQPEMERWRSPLVSIPPFQGGDFQGIGVYRSDEDSKEGQDTGFSDAVHRLDQPTRLSLGLVASTQCPPPFHLAKTL